MITIYETSRYGNLGIKRREMLRETEHCFFWMDGCVERMAVKTLAHHRSYAEARAYHIKAAVETLHRAETAVLAARAAVEAAQAIPEAE